jgi:N-acyl homoserine lactone hydrolase
MTRALKLWPLLTGTNRYEKIVSTKNTGHGQFIDAPILAYLIETPNGRILYDVGCDYHKVSNPQLSAQFYDPMRPLFEPPKMTQQQRIPSYLAKLGLSTKDIDVVFLGHLHFDHAGGLKDITGNDITGNDNNRCSCEVHIQAAELAAARTGLDGGVLQDELATSETWHIKMGEYTVAPGVQAIASPGHSAGHMSLIIELPKGKPVIICGDAADLVENLTHEIAPGYCWQDNDALAIASIRKLKDLALRENAQLWPNHDMDFYNSLPQFPTFID